MRKRTNMNGLVSHTTPSGTSYQSGRERAEQKLKRLQKLLEQGYEIAGIKKKEEPDFKIVMVFGKPMKLTLEEYNTYWNFRIDK